MLTLAHLSLTGTKKGPHICDPSVIRLGKVCGIYILIIKRLYRLTFASPTFAPYMACFVVPYFAFTAMSEDVCLHIRFSNLVKYKITNFNPNRKEDDN